MHMPQMLQKESRSALTTRTDMQVRYIHSTSRAYSLNFRTNSGASLCPYRNSFNTGTARFGTCRARSQGHTPNVTDRTIRFLRAVSAVNSESLDTTLIQPIGLRLWRIGGDGRCLFRALAQGAHQLEKGQPLKLAEEQSAADELRKLVCNQMRSRKEDISPFLEVPFDDYIDSMSHAATWGGEPELSVAPECLHRPIDVYMNGATGLQVMSSYTCSKHSHKDPVNVLFNGIGHYDLLIDNSPASKL